MKQHKILKIPAVILILMQIVMLMSVPMSADDTVNLESYNLIIANKNQFKYVDVPYIPILNKTAGNTLGVMLDFDIQNNYIYTVEIELKDTLGTNTHYFDNQSLRMLGLYNTNTQYDKNVYSDISTLKTENQYGFDYLEYTTSNISVQDNLIKAHITFTTSENQINVESDDIGVVMLYEHSADDPVGSQLQLHISNISVNAVSKVVTDSNVSFAAIAHPGENNGTAYIEYTDNELIRSGSTAVFDDTAFMLLYTEMDIEKDHTYQVIWDFNITGLSDRDVNNLIYCIYTFLNVDVLDRLDGLIVSDNMLSLFPYGREAGETVYNLDYGLDAKKFLHDVAVSGDNLRITFQFSTSDGYVDNLISGRYGFAISYYCRDFSFDVNSQKCTVEDITDEETEIFQGYMLQYIQNVANNQQIIMNYGSGYDVPQGGVELGKAQTDLNKAEEAVNTRREQLQNTGQASMTKAITAASELPAEIGNSTALLTGTFTNLWDNLPPEVVSALLTCAAIIFAGWLIGRVR